MNDQITQDIRTIKNVLLWVLVYIPLICGGLYAVYNILVEASRG
jgi:hypothetical protein